MLESRRSARRILHVDMDAFYASVEQLDHPAWRGRPVIVGGGERRGVVCAASYEARASGVRSAMPMARALRLCPHAVQVAPRHARYQEISRQIQEVFAGFASRVEPLSLDESFLDVTERCLAGGLPLIAVARSVKQAVRTATGLTASAGGGPNKLVAKIASDLHKPDGLLIVAPAEVGAFLRPLEVERLWGVGPVTGRRLRELGVSTIGEVRERGERWLAQRLGRFGVELFALACGVDERPVEGAQPPRSLSAECTFAQDVTSGAELEACLAEQAVEVAARLEAHGGLARTVILKLRYADFTTITRSMSPPSRIRGAAEILAFSRCLLERTEFPRRAVRLVGVGVAGLSMGPAPEQLQLPFQAVGGPLR